MSWLKQPNTRRQPPPKNTETIHDVFTDLNRAPGDVKLQESTTPVASDDTPHALSATGLTRTFGDCCVLRDASLTLNHGDYAAITGPSGSGKSTLMSILGLLDSPTSGTLNVAGNDISSMSPTETAHTRATHIGFVFQAFHLLHTRSAVENVELGMLYQNLPAADVHQRSLEALRRVGLSHRTYASPKTMSGGEKQRVAIARAIASSPSILLADEPTGNLDSETTASIMELFRSLHADGLTILTITHEADVAAQASRRFTMNDGTLTEQLHTAAAENPHHETN